MKELLIELAGIKEEDIKVCAGTGLVVDIKGTGAPGKEGVKSIAIRADTDGLKMPENNPDLPYTSKTEYAHMCGHDGHTATLLLAACLLQSQRHTLPEGTLVRLLFQPAEEGPGGAKPMIEEGCLEGIDEVYGMHNVPNFPEGQIRVKAGPMMAAISGVKITIKGKGGHSSVPHSVNDVISAGAAIVQNLHLVKSRHLPSADDFVLSITQFHGGNANNVFPDDAFIDGSLRCYSNDVFKVAKEKIL